MSARTIYLMRHGEPTLAGRMLGRTDCEVTAAGVAACLAQAEQLDMARVVSSDLLRASHCAAAIAAATALPHAVDPRWRELDFGAWDGKAGTEIDPAALGAFWDDPDASPPPGGERWSALAARVSAALDDLPSEPTLIVTHGGAIRAALHGLCGFAQPQLWAIDLPYACVLALRIWPGPRLSGQIVALWP